LTRTDAIELASNELLKSFGEKEDEEKKKDFSLFHVVGETSEKQSSGRIDWSIKFKLNETNTNEEIALKFWPSFLRKNSTGDHRISLRLDGNEVVEQTGFVDIPQDWLRKNARERELPKLIESIMSLILKAILIVLTANSLLKWKTSFRLFGWLFIFILFELISLFFSWDAIQASFDPNVPYFQQTAQSITIRIWSVIVEFIFFVSNYSHVTSAYPFRQFDICSISLGISIGIILNVSWILFRSLFMKQTLAFAPLWISTLDLIILESEYPIFSGCFLTLRNFSMFCLSISLIVHFLDRISNYFTRRIFLTFLLTLFISFLSIGSLFGIGIDFFDEFFLASISFSFVLSFFYSFVFRDNAHFIPISIATHFILSKLRRMFLIKQQSTFVSFQFDLFSIFSIFLFTFFLCKFWPKMKAQEEEKNKRD